MEQQKYDIYKAAGIIIKDGKILSTRSTNSNIFISPGGKLEKGETEVQALIRELNEELSIEVNENDLKKLTDFYAPAAGQPGKIIRMATYFVNQYKGTIVASNEIEELRWLNSVLPRDIIIAPLISQQIIPLLYDQGLIN